MQSISIIAVGKLSQKFWKDACDEYTKRLSAYCRFKVIELKERGEGANALRREAEDFRSALPKKAYVVALCVEGNQLSSNRLATVINNVAMDGKDLCFIIGSSQGIDETFKVECDYKISLSTMTFPHQLARVILTEQIYRAFNIISGGKYHK